MRGESSCSRRCRRGCCRPRYPTAPSNPGSFPALSFIEAYLSNFIEGTEFELAEAEDIVFGDKVPESRFKDAHDILGTFELVNDPARRARTPRDRNDLLELLRTDHSVMLSRRPEVRPGAFKDRRNQVGDHVFVHPELVLGTLQEGFRYHQSLPPASLARSSPRSWSPRYTRSPTATGALPAS